MPGPLKDGIKEEIRTLFAERHSIRQITKTLGLSRNSVRKFIRSEGLVAPKELVAKAEVNPPLAIPSELEPLDFMMLEKMFAKSGEPGTARDYEKHIKTLAIDIGKELGVRGRIDVLRIEGAVAYYIFWRRAYFQSLDTSDKQYCGPFAKRHDKVAKAADTWISASNKAFDQLNRLFRELEVKYNKRGPDLGRNNTFVQNQQVNICKVETEVATSQPLQSIPISNPQDSGSNVNGKLASVYQSRL